MKGLLFCATLVLVQLAGLAKTPSADSVLPRNRINFIVVNTVRDFDLYSKTLALRAQIRGFFHKEKFVVVKVRSSKEMFEKISTVLTAKKAVIGTLWFDSHGYYKNGYSSFSIGHEEFSYRSIRNEQAIEFVKKLAPYCDAHSNALIGACFAGATYQRKLFGDSTVSPMFGDSLMIGLSEALNQTPVFASESWVMMKPGVFRGRFAFAGYPLGKKFRDKAFQPAWERMGKWNMYWPSQKKSFR